MDALNIEPTPQIHPQHWHDWATESAADPDIIRLNVRSLDGDAALDRLLYSDNLSRDNLGRLRRIWLRTYHHCEHGGWWCSGRDLLQGTDAEWGCFKPDRPRLSSKNKGFGERRKPIKYEHPPQEPTGIFALRVPWHIGHRIAQRQGAESAYRERFEQWCWYQYGEAIDVDGAEAPAPWEALWAAEDTGFWSWAIVQNLPLVLTEGAKKAGALLTAGYAAIALPGVWNGRRQPKDEAGQVTSLPYLIPELQLFATEGRTVCFAFDCDPKPRTIAHVSAAITKTGELFARQGCQVHVVRWAEPEKGCDDLIAARGAEAFHQAYAAALDLASWQALRSRRLTYEPAVTLEQRYIEGVEVPAEAQLVGIKAPKGCGKTEWLCQQVAQATARGQRVLVLTHRIQLGQALCDRFGLDYVSEFHSSQTGGVLGYGVCADSLHANSQARFDPDEWQGAAVVVDECEQVFWHLLNGSTCQQHRVPILRNLKQLIRNVVGVAGGRIYLSDADLSDTTLDYVRALAGRDLEPWVLTNRWQAPEDCWDVWLYEGNDPRALVAALEADIAGGGVPFVSTCGQRAKSRWGTRVLADYLQQQFPHKRILRIDAETIADPQHEAYGCVAHLDEVLPGYDIVLASPSLDTGVSIDVRGHFTGVWAIAQGQVATSAVRQQLARVRDPVPRYLWAAAKGISPVGNGSLSVRSLLASEHKSTKAHVQLLTEAGFDELELSFQQESLLAWARYACQQNCDMRAYRDALVAALKAEGHRIHTPEGGPGGDELKANLDRTREATYQAELEQIAAAEPLADGELERLRNKRAKTPQERHKERKGELQLRYSATTVSPELARADDNGWYPQLRLHYYLTAGRDYLQQRDRRRLQAQAERGEGAVWKPDLNRSQRLAQINALERLGVPWLLEQQQLTAQDLAPLAERARSDPWGLKALLGITVTQQMGAVQIVQALLAKLGLKLPYLGRFGPRGERRRYYGGPEPIDDPIERAPIFEAWLQRDRERAEREQQPGTALGVVSTPFQEGSSPNMSGLETTAEAS